MCATINPAQIDKQSKEIANITVLAKALDIDIGDNTAQTIYTNVCQKYNANKVLAQFEYLCSITDDSIDRELATMDNYKKLQQIAKSTKIPYWLQFDDKNASSRIASHIAFCSEIRKNFQKIGVYSEEELKTIRMFEKGAASGIGWFGNNFYMFFESDQVGNGFVPINFLDYNSYTITAEDLYNRYGSRLAETSLLEGYKNNISLYNGNRWTKILKYWNLVKNTSISNIASFFDFRKEFQPDETVLVGMFLHQRFVDVKYDDTDGSLQVNLQPPSKIFSNAPYKLGSIGLAPKSINTPGGNFIVYPSWRESRLASEFDSLRQYYIDFGSTIWWSVYYANPDNTPNSFYGHVDREGCEALVKANYVRSTTLVAWPAIIVRFNLRFYCNTYIELVGKSQTPSQNLKDLIFKDAKILTNK